MSLCWLAVALALVLWPGPAHTERRLQTLVRSSRLVGPHRSSPRRRVLPAPSARVAFVSGAVTGASVGLGVSIPLGTAAGLAVLVAVLLTGRTIRRRAEERDDAALGDAVRMLVLELEAGASPGTALAAAADLGAWCGPVFSAAAEAAENGADVATVLAGLNRADRDDLALAHAWRAAATGAPLAAVLSRVDADLDARRMQMRDVSAALAGPRSSAALLAALPVVGLALGTAMGAQPLAMLFGSSPGQLLLCAGVALDVAGVLWTQRLTTAAERL